MRVPRADEGRKKSGKMTNNNKRRRERGKISTTLYHPWRATKWGEGDGGRRAEGGKVVLLVINEMH